jgi:GAF domain-containing protein/anti-sigma regulatory factor (Ser/Thr protein kinase)
MQCPRCQQQNPSHATFCLACATPVAEAPSQARRYADLTEEIERLRRSLGEALEQRTATGAILHAISRSPKDLPAVLDAVVSTAARLSHSANVSLYQVEGDRMRKVAEHEDGPQLTTLRVGETRPISRTSVSGRAIIDRTIIHVRDHRSAEVAREFPDGARRDTGIYTTLGFPLLADGRALGAFTVYRTEHRPFTESEIALLQSFADQAVIAIENVRLFKELEARNHDLTQALEQQTATSEILRVISSSPTDVQPVFDTIAARAKRLCDARECAVFRFDGEFIHLVAQADTSAAWASALQSAFPRPPGRGSITARAIQTRSLVHIPDVLIDPEFELTEAARASSVRSTLSVPMLREGEVIGAITVDRRESKPFLDKQIGLVKIFADQAVIAIENVRLFKELEARNRDLTEALEQQTATSEILRVISSSPTDVQPVFDAIAHSAARLCEAFDVIVLRVQGDVLHLVAHHGQMPAAADVPLHRGTLGGRTLIERRLIHIRDLQTEVDDFPEGSAFARAFGHRTTLSVPLLREDIAIGNIQVRRQEVRPFSDTQISLLKTFADQAVIAIENVRLFTELQEKNHALTEAHAQVIQTLEQQTATSEILSVISSSPTDVRPVFDTIVRSAMRLLGGFSATLRQLAGDRLDLVAFSITSEVGDEALKSLSQLPLAHDPMYAQMVRDRAPSFSSDTETDPRVGSRRRESARARGYRSVLIVPMLCGGSMIGAIAVTRREPGPFTDDQIGLLKTFAEQAVIAVENVRLFTELQTSNRELTTALDTQTATSDILRIISRSQTDVQPVFEAIVASAVRLLQAYSGVLTLIEGDQIELAAHTSTDEAGDAAVRAAFPQSRHSEWPPAQAIRGRAPINIADAHTDPRVPETQHAHARVRGYRSVVAVPLLRHDEAAGAIGVTRRAPGGFTDDEIALLKTFADQAVIAIENARLLTELQARTQELSRSVGELRALGEVGQAISSTLDLGTVLTTIVSRAVQLSGLDGGVVFEYDEGTEEFVQRAGTDPGGALAEARRTTRIRKGEGVLGRTAITLEPIQVPDITVPAAYEGRLREILVESGIRAILAVPMVREGRLIGCLAVTRNQPGDFPGETIELLRTFATQSALAIQNARLFHEIADKSAQLEAASRHKSEFLANMSHELRTPLNAVIGFSEVLLQRMFGDLNDKQDEYLKDIYASGQHLLSLINDILDLSKIEAGRMELASAPFHLPTALENAVTLVKERAARHGITLQVDIDPRLGELVGDERKVKQVLLNLLSNAVKFTPERGRISLKAGRTDGMVEIAVTDTGIGIAPEDQAAVFEEFRQVGTDETRKQEGTGLGLTLAKKFVELHGGRIWIESEPGRGSTFTFTLPVS